MSVVYQIRTGLGWFLLLGFITPDLYAIPNVTNVSSTTADGTYGPGDTLDVTVTFSEIVNVDTGSVRCGDFLINSLPFTHQYSNVNQGNEWNVNGTDGVDVAYTLILSDSTTISVTNCAVFTDYDTKLEIFTFDGDCDTTYTAAISTGDYNDDNPTCTISSVDPPRFAALLSDVTLAPGTYYIVVDGFNGKTGNYQLDITEITGRFENDNYALNDSIIETSDHPEFLYIEDYNYEVNKLGRDGYRAWEIKEMLSITDPDPIGSSRTSGTNTPKITLETGATDSAAYYVSGTGTTTILFQYVIQSGDSSNDLDYISTSALEENGGTIRDVSFNDAILTLPTPGTAGSLAANKALVIDGIVPTVVSVSSTSLDSTYDVGSVIPITIAFNENVIATGTPQLELSTGVNTCLSFDGSDDYAFVPNHSDLQFGTGDFSISVWIKIDAIGSTQQIFCKRGGDGNYEIQVNSAGRLSVWAPLGFSGSTVLSVNTWYNVTLIRNNPTSYLYLNGTLEASYSNVGNQNSTSGLSIGQDSYGGERFNGNIDEFAIWNSGLSAAEALAIYNGNASLNLLTNSGDYGSSSNLVLYLQMNDGSGNAAVDATGNDHHATLYNGVAWANNTTSVNYTNGSGGTILTFDYSVAAGHASSDLGYASTTALGLNGGTITDLVGNVANLILPIPGTPGSLSANKAIVIENLPPAIPNGLTATASNRKIFLSWDQNKERDFYHYLVYGDTVSSPSTIVATITGISDTSVIISNLENDDTYYYRLSAIDSSGLESEKTLDVYSVPRPQRYEVNPNQTGDFISIQSAINYATEDDTLIVRDGTYSENIDLLGKALIIGSEYFTSGDSAHIASTVIDGQLNGSTITISDISGSEIKLVGFTIQNGSASDGGAIYSSNSNPVFENLIIKNSTASNSGGGIYLYNNSSAILNKLKIINNSAKNGGGLYLNSSNPTITNIVFSNNTADSSGGAIAMYSNSNPGFYNALIYDNYAGLFGGSLQISNSNPTIGNSTIIANNGQFQGGALYLTGGSEVVVTNSILYNNIPEQLFINDPEDSLTVSFSNVEGDSGGLNYSHLIDSVSMPLVTWAQSNIDVDPLFIDAINDEYGLSDYSLAIGAGSSVNSVNSDINGSYRPAPVGSDPDMGAYENLRSIPDVWLALVNDQYFINEDSTLLFNPVLNDSIVNIHLVNLAIVDSANHGSLQIASDSTIYYYPDQNYFGMDTILYAFHNTDRRDSALTIITINMLEDDPPVITSSDTSFAVEDETYNYLYDGYDPDIGGISRWEIDNVPTWLSMENDSIIGTPLEGDLDTSFLLIYSDTYFSDTLEVGIFVTPVNDPPEIISADSIIINEPEYYVYNAFAEDPEDSSLAWIFSGLPSWMSAAGDSSFGSPNEGAPDTSFTIMVTDGEYWDSSSVFVDVIPFNDLPVITSSDSLLAIEDEFVTFNFGGYDPEGLPLLWSVNHLPSWLSMESDDVYGIPSEGDLDTLFTLIASDGLLNDSLIIGVYVASVNDAPEITSLNIDTAYVDEYFVYYPFATDPEDSTLIWELLSPPQWMIIAGDSVYGLVPSGSDETTFTIVVSDGNLTDTLDVIIEIIDINYPPEITFAQLVGEYHDDIELTFHLYDFDDDDLDYDISFTSDGINWNNATISEQGGTAGQDTMMVIWHSMSDLAGIYNSNVQLKIIAYDLDTDTLQIPDDTSSILISDLFALDNHIGSLSVSMAETMDEYFDNIALTYAIEDTTGDPYEINMNYSLDNGNSWLPATLQGNLIDISITDYLDSLTWMSDEDLVSIDTSILLEVSMSDGWQSSASNQIAIHFDNQVLPLLTTIQPDTGQYIYWYDQITLTFTGQMDLESYADGVMLESNQRGVLEYDAEFIQGNEIAHLIITPLENYYADEQIQISINQQLRDVWNNPFDGNGNGDPDGVADEDTILFAINLLGDYDRSSLIDFEDLVALQQNWWDETVNPADEIGPAAGTPPFMQIQPDSKMDFEDLMVFVQMWNWSNGFDYNRYRIAMSRQAKENYTTISVSYPPPQVGDDVEELYLYVDLDSIQAVGALGLELSYDPETIDFVDQSSRFDQHWTKLSYHDSASHRIVIQLADLDQEIRIQPINKQVKLKFRRLMDTDTEVIWGIDLRDRAGKTREVFTQSYKFSTTAPMPDQYVLHQNYPNPFNPSTTIRYDLPEDSHIRIAIYNILGQEIRVLADGLEPAGFRLTYWHGKDNFNRNVSAGVYLLLMKSKDFTLTRKLILLK